MQQKIAEKEHKYFVLKLDDLRDLCELERVVAHELEHVISRYTAYRNFCKKDPDPKYIVCNQDEPYAEEVWKVILDGEDVKNGIIRKPGRIVPVEDLIKAGIEVMKAGVEISPYRETLSEIYAATKGQCPDEIDSYLWQRVAGLVGEDG